MISVQKTKLLLIALALFGAFSNAANADSLRCGTNLVELGEVKAEVIEKCGEPIATDSFCRNEYLPQRYGYDAICRNVDLWTFNFGTGTFLMNIEFEEGRVSSITHGDRVR